MQVVPPTALVKDGYVEINRSRDYQALIPITRGGTGSTTAANARTALAAVGTAQLATADLAAAGKIPVYNAAAQLATADPTLGGHAASKQYVDRHLRDALDLIQALVERVEALERPTPN
jgi:hypothetical protein